MYIYKIAFLYFHILGSARRATPLEYTTEITSRHQGLRRSDVTSNTSAPTTGNLAATTLACIRRHAR